MAAAAAQAFFTTPAFMEELEGVREELRGVLGYGETAKQRATTPATPGSAEEKAN